MRKRTSVSTGAHLCLKTEMRYKVALNGDFCFAMGRSHTALLYACATIFSTLESKGK